MSNKEHQGKWVVIAFVVVALFLGAILALVFRDASLLKGQVVEKIHTEFLGYATQINPSQKLQIAELNQVESFERESSGKLWNFQLPTVVVAITAPVSFVYVVDLKKPWNFQLEDDILIVTAPEMEWNPPAPDLSATRFDVRQGSVFRDEAAVMRSLKADFTPLLQARAAQNLALVRETARSSLHDIVLNWFKAQDPSGKEPKIKVIFADEGPSKNR